MDIRLNPEIETLVSRQVQSGRFPTAADVIESAVLLLTGSVVVAGAERPLERHSPRGLLADLRSNISADDIKDARHEMWSGFTHGEA